MSSTNFEPQAEPVRTGPELRRHYRFGNTTYHKPLREGVLESVRIGRKHIHTPEMQQRFVERMQARARGVQS